MTITSSRGELPQGSQAIHTWLPWEPNHQTPGSSTASAPSVINPLEYPLLKPRSESFTFSYCQKPQPKTQDFPFGQQELPQLRRHAMGESEKERARAIARSPQCEVPHWWNLLFNT